MSKNIELTELEFNEFQFLNIRSLQYLKNYLSESGKDKSEIRILDWGCGRVRQTLWLNEKGYKTYGVDIDSLPINNGLGLFIEKGYSQKTLSLIDQNCKTQFPDDYFDYIYSNQVFEHIKDIENVAKEMSRITKSGGHGFHVLPAQHSVIEGHLHLPFVHWLPKNVLRKYLISIFVFLGVEPKWSGLKSKDRIEKIEILYRYMNEKTFYRKYSSIKTLFNRYGFLTSSEIINNPKLTETSLFTMISGNKFLVKLIHAFIRNYKTIEFLVKKKSI